MQEMTYKTQIDKEGNKKRVMVYADTEETHYQRIKRLRKQYE